MVSGGAVGTIELGEVRAAELAAGAQAELPARTRRTLAGVLTLAACVAGLGGSAPARHIFGEPLWTGTISLAGFRLGSQSVYLAEPNGRVVVAKDLLTGRTRWRLPIEQMPMYSEDVGGGVAAVVTHMPTHNELEEPTVTLVAEATGQVLGVGTGNLVGRSAAGRRLIMTHQRGYGTADCPEWGEPCWDVVALDTTTGAEVQRIALEPQSVLASSIVDGAVEAYASVSPTGAVRVYDAASGRLVDTMTLLGYGSGTAGGDLLLPDLFVTARRVGDDVRMSAYRRAPLTLVWSTLVPVTPAGQYPSWWLAGFDCGPVVCLAADGRTVLVDRASGRVRFTVAGDAVVPVSDRILLAAPAPADLVPSPGRPTALVVDAGTGAVRQSVNKVMPVDWFGSGPRRLLAQQGPARTAFIVVDADGSLRTLGSVAGTDLACAARAGIVACSEPTGTLRVWRLPA